MIIEKIIKALVTRPIKNTINKLRWSDVFRKRLTIESNAFQRLNRIIYDGENNKITLTNVTSYKNLSVDIRGSNNDIFIAPNCYFASNDSIHIAGSNNRIKIDEGCCFGEGCKIWIEGDNSSIHIGKRSSFTCFVHISAQEQNQHITIGEDCMFSNHIIVNTSDAHPIFDKETHLRINKAKNVHIGNHVWIAPDSRIMKGAEIGDGAIIGTYTIVSKTVPSNCLAVGMPAKVVKEDIEWTRHDVLHQIVDIKPIEI